MVPLAVALLLSAAEPGTGQVPVPRAWNQRFSLTPESGIDAQFFASGRINNVALWAELEFGFMPLQWLRLNVLAGGAWSPEDRPSFPGQHGTLRGLVGADFIAAFGWGNVFVGAAGGIQHTNLFGDEDSPPHPNYSTPWSSGPCFVIRAGAELRLSERFSIGGGLGYGYFVKFVDAQHSLEIRARLSFQFGG